MKAWVVRWEGDWERDGISDPFITVFRRAASPQKVKDFVERYYAIKILSPEEQVGAFLRRGARREPLSYPGEWERIDGIPFHGALTCGHNPWIAARLADVHNENGKIIWEDQPFPPFRRLQRD